MDVKCITALQFALEFPLGLKYMQEDRLLAAVIAALVTLFIEGVRSSAMITHNKKRHRWP